ncbi:MAG: hypothetical protein AAGK09_15140 [Planctomycetota bacterium]
MLENLYIYTALGGGLFLLVQFGLLLLGMGDDLADGGDVSGGTIDDAGDIAPADPDAQPHDHWTDKVDGDLDAPGGAWFYEIFSLRSLSGGALFFGLVGKTALVYGASDTSAALYATAAGGTALYAVYWVFKQVFRLETSGNEDVRNALGLPAKVYVPIPPAGEGAGKVQLKMQGRLVEYQAVADGAAKLATGRHVVVTGIVNSSTLRVAPEEAA